MQDNSLTTAMYESSVWEYYLYSSVLILNKHSFDSMYSRVWDMPIDMIAYHREYDNEWE